MKNIESILKSVGLEIPADKKNDFEKVFNENYKTIKEVDSLQGKLDTANSEKADLQKKYDEDIAKRDEDLETLQNQLKETEGDAEKLSTITKELHKLKEDYATAKNDYEKSLAKQKYESLVREKTNELKFSSNSAKKAFLADALAQELSIKDGDLLGFTDYVEKYKETDADAFKVEEPSEPDPEPTPKPSFSTKSSSPKEPKEDDFERPLIL